MKDARGLIRCWDVNTNKSVKEWIVGMDVSPTRIKLQHVLRGVDLKGEHMRGGIIRHTGEDWEWNAARVAVHARRCSATSPSP